MEEALTNTNDDKLLEFCKTTPKSIRQIARHLDIAHKNVYVKLERLEKRKLIEIKKVGKINKMLVKTREDKKTAEYTYQILKALEERGEITRDQYHELLPLDDGTDIKETHNKIIVLTSLRFSDKMENIIRLSKKGKKFLMENIK